MPHIDRMLPVYPIRTVARLTGVNPRTLRGWERQNGLLSPARTEGGHRLFSEEDVKRIRWIKALLDRGMSLKGIQQLIVSVSARDRPESLGAGLNARPRDDKASHPPQDDPADLVKKRT